MNLKFKADYYTSGSGRCRKGEVHNIKNESECELLIRIGTAIPFETPVNAKEKILAMGNDETIVLLKDMKIKLTTKEEKFNPETKKKRGRPFRT